MSLRRVRLNVKLASEAPRTSGTSVVSVTSPAAFGVTRMSTGSVPIEPSLVARSVIRSVPAWAVSGTVTSRVTSVGSEPFDWTPLTRNPPPRTVASQSAGTSDTARSTRPALSVSTDTVRLTLAPGATSIAG